MPELPDVTVYVEALEARTVGHKLLKVGIRGPFLLRSTSPPLEAVQGKTVLGVRRLGKRIVFELEDQLFLALHLMIAGRLHWRDAFSKPAARTVLAFFEFDSGMLTFTEAGTQHRAQLHVIAGEEGLQALSAGGLEVMEAELAEFAAVLRSANHTLKRALTDPHLFSGIGNAYSDEILHRAKLSPIALTLKLSPAEIARLYEAVRESLREWTDRLRTDAKGKFPEKVTAFREGMATHGRYKQPCPRCGTPIQRIRYAANETNYCPTCQTNGKLLADRALSRLLREDWPRSLDELDALKRR